MPIRPRGPRGRKIHGGRKRRARKGKRPIRYVTDQIKRRKTFRNRKMGVMKKASQLATLTKCELLMIVADSDTKQFHYYSTPIFRGVVHDNIDQIGNKLARTIFNKSGKKKKETGDEEDKQGAKKTRKRKRKWKKLKFFMRNKKRKKEVPVVEKKRKSRGGVRPTQSLKNLVLGTRKGRIYPPGVESPIPIKKREYTLSPLLKFKKKKREESGERNQKMDKGELIRKLKDFKKRKEERMKERDLESP